MCGSYLQINVTEVPALTLNDRVARSYHLKITSKIDRDIRMRIVVFATCHRADGIRDNRKINFADGESMTSFKS